MRRKTLIAVLFLARSALPQTPDDARTKMGEAMRAGAVSCKAEDKADQVEITCPIDSVSLADLIKALHDAEQDKPVKVVFLKADPWKLSTLDIKNIKEINELLDEGITKGQGGHVRFYVEDKNDRTSNRIGTQRMMFAKTLFMMSTAYMEQQGAISTAIAIKRGLVSWQMQK
jgi:hypothetical protein